MFNNISKRYDLLNHLLSLNIDKGWRRKVVNMVKADAPTLVLDVATGTADLAIALAKGTGADITGADIMMHPHLQLLLSLHKSNFCLRLLFLENDHMLLNPT